MAMSLEVLDQKLHDVHKQQELLQRDGKKQDDLYLELKSKESTLSTLKEVFTVNRESSMIVHLYRDTRSTPIISSFDSSEKDYLVFENAFSIGPKWEHVSLVVVKHRPFLLPIYSGFTMTNLKRIVGTVIGDYYLEFQKKTSRQYPLVKELVDAGNVISATVKRIAFEQPIRLGGQTYEDQTGFGSEYHGPYMVKQGKEYGEDHGFYIIGVVTDVDVK